MATETLVAKPLDAPESETRESIDRRIADTFHAMNNLLEGMDADDKQKIVRSLMAMHTSAYGAHTDLHVTDR